ncbi:AMP-binding protein [uncultured Algibacter sp.]|uniref:AMP-binding protein n=1 Tax=uncultured Algibacter sp. TaxID=298659 RepID=UPI00261A1EE0|nr:AMP-binding protein [uncultured Algibacter sp.]
MNLIPNLKKSFEKHASKNALCINDVFYTYKAFSEQILKIRKLIQTEISSKEKFIGLITNDDIQTYASIFALWFENKAYIPINPSAPMQRNKEVLNSTGASYILNSNIDAFNDEAFSVLPTHNIGYNSYKIKEGEINQNGIAYILFTSGSTGKPKGIPITLKNVDSLIYALTYDGEYILNDSDRCLQMYDLTFDASLTAFLPAFLSGACSYTVPPGSMKYFHIFKLLQKYELTVLKMVPSIIHYLRPYFSEIYATSVRYCIFGGGKLYEDIVKEWLKCIPNSKLYNHYGPTECTVCSTYHTYSNTLGKSHNGVISIGKPLKGFNHLIIDDKNNIIESGDEGELCLSGPQVTLGYWKNDTLNSASFFTKEVNGILEQFYKTGDICYEDSEGYLMYIERKDFQVKIRGFRVELGEIEFHSKKVITKNNLSIIDINNSNGNNEIALVIEGKAFDIKELQNHLQSVLPNYMVPTKYFFLDNFPHNTNGKLDRKALRNLIKTD